MNSRLWGLSGAALLAIGLFTPVVSIPIFGNVNLFNNGSNWSALVLLVMAALAAVLSLTERETTLVWPGAAAAAALLYLFVRLQYGLSQMRAAAATSLADNPFAGIAQAALGSVQVQWGWLVLAAGAGAILYAGIKARRDAELALFDASDPPVRLVAIVSGLLLLVLGGIDLAKRDGGFDAATPDSAAGEEASTEATADATTATGPSREEADYIRDHLKLYDLKADYYDSMLDGRVPGVEFKIKNDGGRTLNGVDVRIEFLDEGGKPIAEEIYYPVNVSDYSYGSESTPLRPNYIWQNESGQFYAAKSVPSEWSAGKATASITDIEFAPKER